MKTHGKFCFHFTRTPPVWNEVRRYNLRNECFLTSRCTVIQTSRSLFSQTGWPQSSQDFFCPVPKIRQAHYHAQLFTQCQGSHFNLHVCTVSSVLMAPSAQPLFVSIQIKRLLTSGSMPCLEFHSVFRFCYIYILEELY